MSGSVSRLEWCPAYIVRYLLTTRVIDIPVMHLVGHGIFPTLALMGSHAIICAEDVWEVG